MGRVPGPIPAIVGREFPDQELRRVTDVSGGQKSTYLVDLSDGAVVVSVGDTAGPEFATEPAVMRLVRRQTGVPVPRVIASDLEDSSLPPYYVTERIEGKPLSDGYTALTDDVSRRILSTAGRYLGELHRKVSLDDFGRLGPAADGITVLGAESWPAFLGDLMGDWIAQLEGGRFEDLTSTFARAREACVAALDGPFEPTLLHFDYRPENLLIDGDEVVAVLDWGLSVAGHSEYDFFKAEKNFLRAQFDSDARKDRYRPWLYRGYRDEQGLAPGWRTRRQFYNLAYTLESMYSFPRWTREMDPDEKAEMEATLRTELDARLDRLSL